ncbi:uncharacterized protein LOC122291037 [Carya illinoinensis]|uniref:uncharacterized protein LOC122291037 n=1 Tax=Carya illinoinensis TaxID=32201 RepID=UPI001C717E37|nr:uncharacterized protein LOC122291037 [Carya illinoinensis]
MARSFGKHPNMENMVFIMSNVVVKVIIRLSIRQVKRRVLWKDLEDIDPRNFTWLVRGDFNIIREDGERIGGHSQPLAAMEEFNNCLDNCGLIEASYHGSRVSGCNSHSGSTRSWARMDRAVQNMDFMAFFHNAHFEYFSSKSSDHSPMLLRLDRVFNRYGPSPFKFQNMWCAHASFKACVAEVWNAVEVSSGLWRLATKLKKMRLALRA